jgi:hypothetical protein
MFVRFRQTGTRLQASLIQSRRVGGKVCHEHVASLGTVAVLPSVAERVVFWQSLHERVARLGNRFDAATRAKLLGDIHTRVPMVTPEEQRGLQLANAKADAQFWDTLADAHAGTIEGLIASAERTKAAAEAARAEVAEQAARAKDRIARIERGEDVAGGLGKPVEFNERFLLDVGFTRAAIARFVQTYEVSEAFGFEAMRDAIVDANARAERRVLRALHRRIIAAEADVSDGENS